MTRPLVLAHRGASGYRPELTEAAIRLAAAQGADGVEIDVVPTRDGRLAVRHDAALDATTDAGAVLGPGTSTDGLLWADVRRLRARERLPALRRASAAYDGLEPVLELPEVVALAEELGLLLVVEIKDATRFASAGLDPVPLVERDLAGARCPIVLESFEQRPLDALAHLGHPAMYLVDDAGAAADLPDGPSYTAQLADPASLTRFAGVSIGTPRVEPRLVGALQHAGLDVWTWTLRPENAFLAPEHRIGEDPAAFGDWRAEWLALYSAGVDAVFADHPDLAIALRDRP